MTNHPEQKPEISVNVSDISTFDRETLSTIFAEIKEKVSNQKDVINRLENKADKMIGFVTIFAGLAIAGMQFFLKNELAQLLSRRTLIVSYAIYIVAAGFFLISICLAISAYGVEPYRSDPDPRALAENYLFHSHDRLLRQLIDNLADSYKANESIMHRKARRVTSSLLSFVIGLTIIFSFLVILLASRV